MINLKKREKCKEKGHVSNFMSLSLMLVYIILLIRLSTILYLNLVYHIMYHTDLIVTFIIYFSMRLVILIIDNNIRQKEKNDILNHLFEDHDE